MTATAKVAGTPTRRTSAPISLSGRSTLLVPDGLQRRSPLPALAFGAVTRGSDSRAEHAPIPTGR